MLKSGDHPYWNEPQFQTAKNSNADVVVLMLGTNDAKTFNWNETAFKADYLDMINVFKNMTSKPDIHLMIPPPLYKEGVYSM